MAIHTSATAREQAPDVTQPYITHTPNVNQTTRTRSHNGLACGPGAQRMEALAEIICGAGDEAAGALFVLMGTLQHSTDPEALANAVKHLAFTRCGELNVFGMVDAQLAVIEGELFARSALVS